MDERITELENKVKNLSIKTNIGDKNYGTLC